MYRVRQFFFALTARTDQYAEMARLLTPAQRELFQQMAPADQRHSIDVCWTLLQSGDDDPDLLAAALLHDVGKSAGHISLWQRALVVVLGRWAPRLLNWLARDASHATAPRWRSGFVINRLHPEVGARWAAKAGCSSTTVALIRRHQERVAAVECELDRLLAALQRADGVN